MSSLKYKFFPLGKAILVSFGILKIDVAKGLGGPFGGPSVQNL